MHAQLTYFDSPRSAAEVAAADFAGRERIEPSVAHLPGVLATYVLRRDDGSGLVVTLADSEATLIRAGKVVMSTELLPGEDPALLRGPDRIEILAVAAPATLETGVSR